jgi:hypothetical protein
MNLTPERIDELRRELRALPPAPRIRTAATKLEAIEKVAPELLSLRRMATASMRWPRSCRRRASQSRPVR